MDRRLVSSYNRSGYEIESISFIQADTVHDLQHNSPLLTIVISVICGVLVAVVAMFLCLHWGRFTIRLTFMKKKGRLPPKEKQSIDFVVPDIRVTQVYVTTPISIKSMKYSPAPSSTLAAPHTRSRSSSISSISVDDYHSDLSLGVASVSDEDRYHLMPPSRRSRRHKLSGSESNLLDRPNLASHDSSSVLEPSEELCRRYTMERFDIQPKELDRAQYTQSENALDSCKQYSSCEHGMINFSVAYNCTTEVLTVVVRRVVNLSPRPNRLFADPYVKLTLLPDKQIKHVTNVHQRTLDPVFCQTFLFPVKKTEFECTSLKLSVCDHLKFFRRNELGHTVFPLKDLGPLPLYMIHREIWKPLIEDQPFQAPVTQPGEILLGIKLDTDRHVFTLSVLQVKGIALPTEEQTHGGVLVKMTVMVGQQIIKSKRTKSAKCFNEENYVYNQEFQVRVPRDCFSRLHVSVSVFLKQTFTTTRLIGRTNLGPYFYASGSGLKHWINMLTSPSESNVMWHQLT